MISPDVALEVVRRSPAAVGRHDKQAWLNLFATDYVVEDPYGGRPVRGGRESLARFWDTYIATRAIRFETVGADIVVGDEVVRDVTIVIVDDAGVELRAPAHLHYVLTDSAQPRIARLAAHWEVGPVLRQLAGVDRARLRSLAATSVRMVRHQRPAEMVGFLRAVNSVGDQGKLAVQKLIAADLLGVSISDVTKSVAAGDCVSLTCNADGRPAVVFCRLDPGALTLRAVAVFPAAVE